jgi:hypothetical protein
VVRNLPKKFKEREQWLDAWLLLPTAWQHAVASFCFVADADVADAAIFPRELWDL